MSIDKETQAELTKLGVEVISKIFLDKTGIDPSSIFSEEYQGFWSKIVAIIRNFLERRKFKKALDKSKEQQGLLFLLSQGKERQQGTTAEHPLHQTRLREYKAQAQSITSNKHPLRINFGDSLTDLARKELSPEYIDYIWSISGSISPNMSQMAIDLKPYLKDLDVDHISVGSINGNSFLGGLDYDWILSQSKIDLDKIRKAYPKTKITVYGLPPTFNLYATEKYVEFDTFLYNWCVADGNANFVSFKKLGNGLFPSVGYSSDGVHLSGKTAINFGQALEEARHAAPGSIIFVNRKTAGLESESINLLIDILTK